MIVTQTIKEIIEKLSIIWSTTLGCIQGNFQNVKEHKEDLSDDSEDESVLSTEGTTKAGGDTKENTEEKTTLDMEGYLENSGYPRGGGIPVLNRKVFKARRVSIHEHPYMASIRRLHVHYLSAALLTRNVVISVAHPVAEVPTTELSVVVGESYSDRASKLTTVLLVILHQDFDPYTLTNDIALLRTYEDVAYKTSVKAILLASANVKTAEVKAFVTGWGRCDSTVFVHAISKIQHSRKRKLKKGIEKESGLVLKGTELCMSRSSKFFPDEKIDPMLRSATFTMSAFNKFCDGYKRFDISLQPGMLCMGPAREEDPLSPCLGAPGAPLVVQARLVGLLSWGLGCGFRYDLPLVYTDVQYYSSWILHNIVLLRKIGKSNLTELFDASKAYVLTNWLTETRVIAPILKLRKDKSMEPLNVDKLLFKLIGKVHDVRDYINDGMYSSDKQIMYSALIHAERNLKLQLSGHALSGHLFAFLAKNSTGTGTSRWITVLENTTPYVKHAPDSSSEDDDTDMSE